MPMRSMITLLSAIGLATIASAEILTVCASGCQYASINDAIVAASEGDVIVNGADLDFVLGYWGLCSGPLSRRPHDPDLDFEGLDVHPEVLLESSSVTEDEAWRNQGGPKSSFTDRPTLGTRGVRCTGTVEAVPIAIEYHEMGTSSLGVGDRDDAGIGAGHGLVPALAFEGLANAGHRRLGGDETDSKEAVSGLGVAQPHLRAGGGPGQHPSFGDHLADHRDHLCDPILDQGDRLPTPSITDILAPGGTGVRVPARLRVGRCRRFVVGIVFDHSNHPGHRVRPL